MSYDEFWHGLPRLAVVYRRAEEYRAKQRNVEQWRMGAYMANAINATVGNMFRKKGSQPVQYLDEPLPLSQKDADERELRKRLEAEERIRLKMMKLAGR